MALYRSTHPLARWASALLLALGVLAQAAAAAPAQTWSIVDIPALGSRGAIALTINNRGDVGGYSAAVPPGAAYDYYHAFIYHDGTMTDLGSELGSPPGYANTQVTVLNDRGTAVISGQAGLKMYSNGQWTSLPFSGSVTDINNKDVIVGSYSYGLGGHAFRYADGMFQDLGTLGGPYSGATAINDRGVIVGSSYVDYSGTQPFVYENGVMRSLGTLGGLYGTATDINSHGVIVGRAQDATGTWQPFIYDARNGLRIMQNVPAGANIFAINDRSVVLGSYPNPNNQGETQFIWKDGVLTALNTLPEVKAAGWGSIFVTDMNDKGQITGWGWKTGGGTFISQSFLLTPR